MIGIICIGDLFALGYSVAAGQSKGRSWTKFHEIIKDLVIFGVPKSKKFKALVENRPIVFDGISLRAAQRADSSILLEAGNFSIGPVGEPLKMYKASPELFKNEYFYIDDDFYFIADPIEKIVHRIRTDAVFDPYYEPMKNEIQAKARESKLDASLKDVYAAYEEPEIPERENKSSNLLN